MKTSSDTAISEMISRGEITCKKCGTLAIKPVIGWAFISGGDSYCPNHVPLSLSFPADEEQK